MSRKQNTLKDYETTLILLSILLVVMSLVIFMPLRNNKHADTSTITNLSK